jgi:hypothetical protein
MKNADKNAITESQGASLDSLLPKQRLFLMRLLEGAKVYDAYKDAGYEGDKGAAYQLKSRLDKELTLLAEAKNMSKSDLLLELGKLNELPVVDKTGAPVSGVSINNKLRILALQQKALEMSKPEAPRITAFQVNTYVGEKKTDAVDTTIVEEK